MTADETATGTVVAVLPRGLYEVALDDGSSVVASAGGFARQTTVKIIPGDHVQVSRSPYDPSRGRIRAKS